MKILFVTPQVPFPIVSKCGAAVKNFNLLKQLSEWHEIYLLTLIETRDQINQLAELNDFCKRIWFIERQEQRLLKRIILTLFTSIPDLVNRIANPKVQEIFKKLINANDFDIIQIEGLEMSLLFFDIQDKTVKKVLDDHNAEYILAWRNMIDRMKQLNIPLAIYSLIQFLKLKIYEKKILGKVDLCLTVSDIDKIYLKRIFPKGNFVTIPTSIELPEEIATFDGNENYILFTGVLYYKPSIKGIVWFANKVFPYIKRQVPDAKLNIVGKDPVNLIESLANGGNIFLNKNVPNIGKYFLKSKVAIVPSKIVGGISTKIMEACAYGVPVVASTVVAQKMGRSIQKNILSSDDPEEFANKVIQLLEDREMWFKISSNARRTMEKEYNIAELAIKLSNAYKELFF